MARFVTLRRWLKHPLLLSFYMPSLLFSVAEGLLIPIMPLYAKELAGTYRLIGLILAADGIGTLLGNVPAGLLLRRLGKRRAMMLGLALTALSTSALFGVDTALGALAFRLLSGVGRSLYGVARHSHVAEVTTAATRGRSIAVVGGVFRLGNFLGPAMGGALATRTGLRAPFLLFGGLAVAAILVVARHVQPGAGSAAALTARVEHKPAPAPSRRRRVLVAAGAGHLFAQLVRKGRNVVIPLYAVDVLGLDAEVIGLITGLSSAIDMTLFLPVGWIMDHWGRKFTIVPTFLILAVSLSLVPLTTNATSLLLVALLVGFGNGLGAGNMMTLGADLAPVKRRGEFLGLWQLVGALGYSGSPLVIGAVADWLALSAATWVTAGTGLVAAFIFLLLVPETLGKRPVTVTPQP